ncbi:protein ced-11 [Ditylenchus destructor]|uniref:Protein ced-11 n=1 Tax=Ditylenchus destructor TaxID=166010 RepID=A0AAD4RBA7_9BILA|nr:protein ced-11 [Ditylenchus destructor]
MDEDAGSSASAVGGPHFGRIPSDSIFTDTVGIFVEPEWGSNTTGGVQLCPAIFLPSTQQIPQSVKHIYSRLASSSSELDQGVPELLLSMVSTGCHGFSFENSERLIKGLGRIISHCGFWAVTSGEQNDPLSAALAAALRYTLPQQKDSFEETLVIAVNSMDVVYKAHSLTGRSNRSPPMTDSRYNTFYIVLNKTNVPQEEMLLFRTCASINLANPPPALLIGVPDDRSSAIILPSGMASVEKRPIPVVLFCAECVYSLTDVENYLQCGVPVLVVHDVSELGALLQASFALYQSSNFDHQRFVKWIDDELFRIASSSKSHYSASELCRARKAICYILLCTQTNPHLLSFINAEDFENLPEHLLDLLVGNAADSSDLVRVIRLAVKLNSPSVLKMVKLEPSITDEQVDEILAEALAADDHLDVLSSLLDQNIPIRISSDLLLNWLENTSDQYFFNAIILGHFLGVSYKLERINEYTARCINELLCKLSGVVNSLFPPEYFARPVAADDRAKGIQVLAVWALLLGRTELVKLLCAYSHEPLALCLVLAKVSRNLARKSRDWFFYEQRFLSLSKYLNSTAVLLLNTAYEESPTKAYQSLCRPLSSFGQLTLTQLAYEMNARDFIAHDCCQRYVLRLLYGDLQLRALSPTFRLPNWFKISLSSLFIVPITWWVTIRPNSLASSRHKEMFRPASPTVALLEDGRQVKKVRANSTYSMHSISRSAYMHDSASLSGTGGLTSAFGPPLEFGSALEPDTPQSVIQHPALFVDETDVFLPQQTQNYYTDQRHSSSPSNFHTTRHQKRRQRRHSNISLFSMFYSVPITKFWLSLVFRLIYLCLLATSVAWPSCGIVALDFILWLWALMWLVESLWILNIRMENASWHEMPWNVFDIFCLSLFLLSLLVARVASTYFTSISHFTSLAYAQKAIWSVLLLYESYRTLFIYIPLSDVLGPLMIRIKLMIMRDFVYFFILMVLVIFSSAFAIKAVVYPDLSLRPSVISDTISWAFMQLLTTDLSLLKETDECRRMWLPDQSRSQCKSIGGYVDPRCPAQSWVSHFAVIEYMIVLKLITWPILFALFARTAKQVDDEADHIWKYQLYSLATNFSIRPCLPPPLTPIYLIILACCRMTGCVPRRIFDKSSTDHPDVQIMISSSLNKPSTVYRNPSVPASRIKGQNRYWTRLSILYWKSHRLARPSMRTSNNVNRLAEKARAFFGPESCAPQVVQQPSPIQTVDGEDNSPQKLSIPDEMRPWDYLLPKYSPPNYSKLISEFSVELQRHVQDTSTQNLLELARQWRQQKFTELLTASKSRTISLLSGNGLPLNPLGRTGTEGRGKYPRFGPNRLFFYVVIAKNKRSNTLMVLTTTAEESTPQLPSRWRNGIVRSDEFLHHLLTLLGVPDTDIQRLTSRGYLTVGEAENHLAHVACSPLPSNQDTDNSWTEADVWAADLSYLSDLNLDIENYEWQPVNACGLPPKPLEFVNLSVTTLNVI